MRGYDVMMDIARIYEELDALKYPEIEGYLRDKIAEAKERDAFDIYIPLLNELIGFFRDSTQFDKGASIKEELLKALESYGQQDTMNQATSLLNIANFDRAAGAYEESLREFKKCEEIYHRLLAKGDYLWAGLYNNKSLLYQEMGDNLAAIGALQDALYIVKEIPEREIEVATTYVNIAQSFASLGQIEEAKTNVGEALRIFKKDGNRDYHYSDHRWGSRLLRGNRICADHRAHRFRLCYHHTADGDPYCSDSGDPGDSCGEHPGD